ncbi:MAG TPA: energy transducer TonB [Spirochaetota bacterium]
MIHVRHHQYLVRHLFRFSLIISIALHFFIFGGYFVTKYLHGSISLENGMDLEKADIDLDIPPEMIGGDTSPAPVEKQEWIEGTKKTGPDHVEDDINTNQISGDGKDPNGFLFSFNGDVVTQIITDFDVRQYYPAAAKEANIRQYTVVVLTQIDENGKLVSAKVISGKAPYGFNEAAMKVVNRARFSPGYKSGKRIKMTHPFPINFVLDE